MKQEERIEQLLLAQRYLGRIFPLWGVVAGPDGKLRCECGRRDCLEKNSGKHPRRSGWQEYASDDPATLLDWCRKYPSGNFGIETGKISLGLDCDLRPDKNGLYELECLEMDNGIRLQQTPTVVTGRDNGSEHRYFRVPTTQIKNSTDFLPGLDIRTKGAYCVAPGSRHISGGFYRFAEELRPDEVDLAEFPGYLLELMPEEESRDGIAGPQLPPKQSVDLSGREGLDEPLSDSVVLGVLNRDRVARFYWKGGHRANQSPSEDDFALACKLAFYCRHNLPQMYRLFMKSGLFRPKFLKVSKGVPYALRTLEAAIAATPNRSVRRKRVRPSKATGAKKGRKTSQEAMVVLDFRSRHPELSSKAMASELGMKTSKVRDILYYFRDRIASGMPSENAWTLIHTSAIGKVEAGESGSKDSKEVEIEDNVNYACWGGFSGPGWLFRG